MPRELQPTNPSTPSDSIEGASFMAPQSGAIIVEATVTRDSGDGSPVTVRLLNETTVLGSENLETSSGPGSVTFNVDAGLLGDACQIEPTIDVIPCEDCVPRVFTSCCSEGIPETLMLEIINLFTPCEYFDIGDKFPLKYYPTGTGPYASASVSLGWNPGYWNNEFDFLPVPGGVNLICTGTGIEMYPFFWDFSYTCNPFVFYGHIIPSNAICSPDFKISAE